MSNIPEAKLYILQDGSYSILSRTQLPTLNVLKRRIPRNCKPPRMYGLPKIHKNNYRLRPIVSTLECPTYNTAQYLARILKEYTGKTSSHILNSSHFVQLISAISLDPEDRIVMTDNLHFVVISREKSLTSTYFTFQGQFYKQISGTPMGSPLSPVVANILMETFEDTAIESAQPKPKVRFRDMDDTFVIWPHGQNALSVFHDHLNSQHPDIQFTMGVETNNCLPFLDVMVTRLPEGRLGHSVYRKPTHSDRYLHATSHHHCTQKRSVIGSLIHRAIKISQPDKLQNELEHLQTSLRQNGYDHHTIKSGIQRRINPNSDNISNRQTYLPFISQVTDRLAKILKSQKVKTIFKPATKIAQIFPSVKDSRQALDCRGIYSIS
ncbi:uncharacterized protein LOC135138683 [Zophobas morio]|uniref:uncharacterized protein LOC135138683 n=1 Tax=Zophobas morio TaxID=2755281 RepID=UPI003082900C